MVKGQAIREDNEDGVKIIFRNVGNSPNRTSSHRTKTLNPQKIVHIMVLLVNSVLICVLFSTFRRHILSPFSGRNFHPILKSWTARSSRTIVTTCKITRRQNTESRDAWRASGVLHESRSSTTNWRTAVIAASFLTANCKLVPDRALRVVSYGTITSCPARPTLDSYMSGSTKHPLDDNRSKLPHVWRLLACFSDIV